MNYIFMDGKSDYFQGNLLHVTSHVISLCYHLESDSLRLSKLWKKLPKGNWKEKRKEKGT